MTRVTRWVEVLNPVRRPRIQENRGRRSQFRHGTGTNTARSCAEARSAKPFL